MVDRVKQQYQHIGLRDADDVQRMSYYRTAFTGQVGDQDVRTALRRSVLAGQDVSPLEQGIRDRIEEIVGKDNLRIDLNTGAVSFPAGKQVRGDQKN